MDRRTWLARAVALLAGLVATGLGLLAAVFGVSSAFPGRRNRERWVALCRTDEVSGEKPLTREFRFRRLDGWFWQDVSRQVFVQKDPAGEFQVLSRRCTHLGCQVRWSETTSTFRCPCHRGVFHRDGTVASGPPPRALDVIPHRIAGDLIEVEEA